MRTSNEPANGLNHGAAVRLHNRASPENSGHPTAPRPDQPRAQHGAPAEPIVAAARTLLFLLLLLFLNLQGDGLPLGHGPAFQLRLLPFTLLFLAGLLALLWPASLARLLPTRLLHLAAAWQTHIALTALFVLLAAALLYAEARLYAPFGYHAHPGALAVLTLLSIAALRTCLSPPASARRLLTIALAILTVLSLFSVWSFPLALQRSDMLPLLSAANHTLLTHHDPYRLYTFRSEAVFLTYLPGTLLAFLPATALGLDLRLTNLACLLGLAALLLWSIRPDRRRDAAALLALFLLGPYLLYRHELYTPPHWLALATALLLAHQRRLRPAAILFGLSIAMSQFSWILFPFFLLFVFETHGRRAVIQALALALVATALLIAPFALADPHAFLLGTFGHWGQIGLTARPINFSFFTAALIGPQHLQLAQLAILILLFVAAVRTHACRTFAGVLRVMVLALTAFILLNLLVWGYFFLLLELLLLLYLLSANGLLRDPIPSLPSLSASEP